MNNAKQNAVGEFSLSELRALYKKYGFKVLSQKFGSVTFALDL